MRISVYGSRELQTVILGLANTDRDEAKQIRQQTKAMAQPEWQKAVAEHVTSRFEWRVLGATARVTVSNQNVQLQSARIGRKLRGGLLPSVGYAAAEFGGSPKQFRPSNRKGYVVYPSAARMIPRIAALWVQTYVRTIHEKLEGR